MKLLLYTALLFLGFSAQAQTKGDVELKTFFATPTSSSVELKWVISAGFTCNGTDIYWSNDSINFERIGGISGICGSFDSDVSYSFTDKKPSSNKLNYYRLQLGTNGDSQTITAFYINLASETSLIIPNPSNLNSTVYFRNDFNRSITFQLYNRNGQMIFEKDNVYDTKVQLDVSNYSNGLYYFLILTENSTAIKGKISVQH